MTQYRVTAMVVLCLGAAASAAAQALPNPLNRAPAGVEEALRERLMKFYTLQMQGQFRQAEALVCADARDTYYDSEKRRWSSADIAKLNFEPGFEKARVLMSLGTEMVNRTGRMPVKYPYLSHWRVDGGTWCFYYPPKASTEIITPFGVMRPGPGVSNAPGSGLPNTARPDPESLAQSVKLSKNELKLLGYEKSSDQIEIVNGLPGPVSIRVQAGELKGLKWTLSKADLAAGEKATLLFDYTPPDKSPKPLYSFTLALEPLGQVIPVQVVFDIPPEVKKQLPEALRK